MEVLNLKGLFFSGGGVNLHKLYPYSLYRWVPPIEIPEMFGDSVFSEQQMAIVDLKTRLDPGSGWRWFPLKPTNAKDSTVKTLPMKKREPTNIGMTTYVHNEKHIWLNTIWYSWWKKSG